MTWADISEIVRRVKEKFALDESKNISSNWKSKLINTIQMEWILETIKKYKQENQILSNDEKKIGFHFNE
jgi:hypothetical protein